MKKTLFYLLFLAATHVQAQTRISLNPKMKGYAKAVIVCDGNSITNGHGNGTPYSTQLSISYPFNLNCSTIYNKGVNGQETSQMTADAATDIDPLYSASAVSIVVAWEMLNDLYYHGNADSAVARMKTYCLARKAVGFKVIVLNVMPATTVSETLILQANALLAAQWADFADAFVDVRSDSRLTNAANTTYFADGVHLTTAGQAIIAELVKVKILSLL